MTLLSTLRSGWRRFARRDRLEQSLDEEIRAYVDLLATEHERAGLPPDEARRRALIETGGVEQVKEATRDAWIGARFANALRELRFTLRSLRNAPMFTLVAVAVLAIGSGGATAIFTAIKGSLLRPLPAVSHPSELVSLEPTKGDSLLYDFSYPDYRELAEQSRSVSSLAGYDGTSMTLADRWAPRRSAWVSYVTGNFFSVLGANPALGRLIQPVDETEENPVVVLAYDFWRSRYGGDSSVIGATVDLAGHPITIVGVAQASFIGAMLMHPMEMWIPLTGVSSRVKGMLDSHADTYVRLVGRLAPGRTIEEAQLEFSILAARLAESYPADKGHGIRVFPGAGMTYEERTALAKMPRLLAVAVGLLLLISCTNVANLSLVRSVTRHRELATRLALGASRGSLIARLLMEGALLAIASAAVGVGIAQLLLHSQRIMRTVAGMPTRVGLDVTLDRRVLAVTLVVSGLTALVVSIAPMLHLMRVTPASLLKDGTSRAGRRRSLGQRWLVAAQIAASLVLLTSAAIVFNAFRRVLATGVGFDPGGLVTASADTREGQLDSAQTIAYRRAWLRRAAAEPSILAVAEASYVPPVPWARRGWIFRAGEEPPPGPPLADSPAGGHRAYLDVVSSAYFDVVRTPVTSGRGFTVGDNEGAVQVVIVSQRLAADLWPHENPIGRMLMAAPSRTRRYAAMRVIGVTGDVRFGSVFEDAPPVAYMPATQHRDASLNFVLRSRDGSEIPDATVRRIGTSVDARVPMYTNSASELIDEQLQPQRIASAWIGVFGAVALLLAAIGLYGVVAQGVLQRTRELAVRSALGATPRGLVSLVIGDGMRIALLGAIVGAAAGVVALRVLQSQFAGIALTDARGAALATVLLCVTMVAACGLPARRASRLNPADALRCD